MDVSKASMENKTAVIRESIRGVPNFPKPGILFWDITTLLTDPKAFRYSIDLFTDRYKDRNVEAVAALESRGFVFAAPLALALNVPLVLLRKPNKLPGTTSFRFGNLNPSRRKDFAIL